VCPHFYELILSNGCPYDCSYCYLKLTFRGKTDPTLFTNKWEAVRKELDKVSEGVFSTGELADSLAIIPPTLPDALHYFSNSSNNCARYLLLVTKSTNVDLLRQRDPSQYIILSFSVNSESVGHLYEKGAPSPIERLTVAKEMISRGWRVRVRLDPIVVSNNLQEYRPICETIAGIEPERVTVGSLRQFPTLKNFAPRAPYDGMQKSKDGRMRYPIEKRIQIYAEIASWLGFQPALCKETEDVWNQLGWRFDGCNCTA
jgi:spore photoproduct lyase